MQLDRPAKRRPRRPRPRQDRSDKPERSDPLQPTDPFQPVQQDPFQPRTTPPRQKNLSFTRPQQQDPFQPPAQFPPAGDAFAQPAPAFGSATDFGQGAPAFGQTPAFGQSAPAFAQIASGPFGQSAAPFGQSTSAFGQSAPSFGQSSADFGKRKSGVRFTQPASGGMTIEPSGKGPAPFKKGASSFGQPASGGMTIEPSGKGPSPFKKVASMFGKPASGGMTIEPSGKSPAPFKRTTSNFRKPASGGMIIEPSGDKPASFTRTPSFAQRLAPFGQKPSPFGRKKASFDQATPFDQNADHESDAFAKSAADPNQTRTPTRRRTRSSAFAKTFDYEPITPRGGDRDADLDIEADSDIPQQTPDPDRKRGHSKNQVLLKSVPVQLFSRAAIQRHFSAVQGVHVTHVSLRGSRRPDSRRTALISFSNEQQALTAMRNGQNFKGSTLLLSMFRQNAHAEQEPVDETNELFFNYVPESLFSEENIRDLFDNISENSVTNVSLKQRPHYGSVKRTAIITFTSADGAGMALRSLPLYKGRTLTVSFRRTRSRPNNTTAAPADTTRYDIGGSAFPTEMVKSKPQDGGEVEEDVPIDVENEYGADEDAGGDSTATDDDEGNVVDDDIDNDVGFNDGEDVGNYIDPSKAEIGDARGLITRKRMAQKQAEISKLKAEILKKEKERTLMTQHDKGKRPKMPTIPKRRESSKTEQEANNSVWRKVGEKVDIKNAASYVGTCMTMCPYKEFDLRIVQRDISTFEMDDEGEPSFAKAVKKYRRSAAVSEQPSPDEVRPPDVLLDAMEHLKKICDLSKSKFADVHNFVRDRTRSLRQDFTLQGVRDESCIKIHEESVRFHILSEHRLYGTDPAVFSSKQNLEQLDKCLISLREMYDLRRDNDLDTSPNEPEMQAYYILTQMSDPKTCVQLCTGFAQDVRCSQEVQFALQVVRAASEGFGSFTRYFSLVRSAPYLMACLMHSRFSAVRARALAVINGTHGNPNSGDNIPLAALTRQLGFEDDEEAEDFCDTLGMTIESVVLPSMPSEVVTIRTPSEGFDAASVSEWESTRADILIESKAEGVKTSEIICGRGRNDFQESSPARKASQSVKTKKTKRSEKQARLFPPLQVEASPKTTRTATDLPSFAGPAVAPKITTPSQVDIPISPKQAFPPISTFDLRPKEDQREDHDLLKEPQSLPVKSPLAKSPKRQRSFQLAPKPISATAVNFLDAQPPLSATKPAVNALSTPFHAILPTKPVESRDIIELPGTGLPQREEVVPLPTQERPELPVWPKLQDQVVEASRKKSMRTAEPDAKPTALDLEKAARYAALMTMVSDLISTTETDFEKVRRIIDDAQTGTLRFPKAMEIWDDAKDILLAVSERTERSLQDFPVEDSPEIDAIHGDNAKIGVLREKLRFCSQEGTELWDQLDEIFSKSLALATAHLRDSAHPPSALPRALQSPDQLSVFPTYGVDDEDAPFEPRDVPERGAEVQSILTAMNSMGLNRWQAVIADLPHLKTNENEVGIAERWIRQRLSTDVEQDSSTLCLLDGTENGSPSISIQEVKQVSSIPYTASLVVVPCDIRAIERDSASAWIILEQILRKNRSIALSCDLPPPSLVILYYCGSSDMPLWFTDESSTRMSFETFQKGLQGKGYVSTCQKLELSRTSAFEYTTCDPFTALMSASVRASAQGLTRMGNVARKTNLRDHLVYVANNAIGVILDSIPLDGDNGAALYAIHGINESWKDVVRLLRQEEARWPKEMAMRTSLMDAYTSIETKLQLPVPRNDSLLSDYISDMAVVVGVGVPANQRLDGPFSFCSALGLVMNAFVRRQLSDCPASVVYLAADCRHKETAMKGRPRGRHHINPSKMEEPDVRVTLKYTPRAEPERKTKRLRDEMPPTDGAKRARYPFRRRLSIATVKPTSEERLSSEFVSKRRQSLPASYGRRRMFELFDGICREEQEFDNLIQATMDALTAKRRRLERRSEVFAT